MRIQHNIAALNSYRNLGVNNSGVAKNLEKLSSGYRINRAGDDAAGLAISEKMRSQITGLNTATKNANDGISLVQTAEGALTEVHSMLNRMVEIATQSANGVYEDGVDRQALQDEMNALTSEIDRIADGTNFNKKNLLDGSLDIRTKGTKNQDAGTASAGLNVTIEFAEAFKGNNLTVTFLSAESATTDVAVENNGNLKVKLAKGLLQKATAAEDIGKAIKENFAAGLAKNTNIKGDDVKKLTELINGMKVTGEGVKVATTEGNVANTVKLSAEVAVTTAKATEFAGTPKAMKLQIGDTSKDFNKLSVAIRDMHAKNLNIDKMSDDGKTGISVETEDKAGKSIDRINEAINAVSTQRGKLGAIQNRLEHTINNLSVNAENMTAAESRIRDVDMADEMMKYTKNNILVQASQAMLAQANQVPQGVLQLLQ